MYEKYNIFDQNYIKGALPAWKYEIQFIIESADYSLINALQLLPNVVKSVNIPDKTLDTITSNYQGLEFNIPTRFSNSNEIEIVFHESHDLSTFKALYDALLVRSFNFKNYFTDSYATGVDTSQLLYDPFDLVIRMYTTKTHNNEDVLEDENQTYTFEKFTNCIITNISSYVFDYSSNEGQTFSISVSYNHMIH